MFNLFIRLQLCLNMKWVFNTRNNPVVSYNLTSAWGGFLLSFSGNGTFNWGVRIISSYNSNAVDIFNSVAIGPQDEIVVTARFDSSALTIVDPKGLIACTISSAGSYDVLAVKFHRNGTLLWVTQLAGTDYEIASTASVDYFGDVLFMSEGSAAFFTVRDPIFNTTINIGAGTRGYALGRSRGTIRYFLVVIRRKYQLSVLIDLGASLHVVTFHRLLQQWRMLCPPTFIQSQVLDQTPAT